MFDGLLNLYFPNSNRSPTLLQQDLRHDPNTIKELEKMRQSPVSPEEGRAMAEKINAFGYLECSGKLEFETFDFQNFESESLNKVFTS